MVERLQMDLFVFTFGLFFMVSLCCYYMYERDYGKEIIECLKMGVRSNDLHYIDRESSKTAIKEKKIQV